LFLEKIIFKMTTNVDVYFIDGCGRCALGATPQCKVNKWQKELAMLRSFIVDCGLTETSKWGVPCYTFQNSNILILSALNEYCTVGFFKGALLADTYGVLIQQTENMQAGRQLRFTNIQDIVARETIVKEYIFEAIEVEKAGLKVDYKKTSDFPIPKELQDKLAENHAFKTAFEALTPGRQRGYLLYFAAPKQSKTRVSRIENSMPKIFNGKGLND
jgi:uncharacterized protein YdeI (YjbR/CyaY-like superfamily)